MLMHIPNHRAFHSSAPLLALAAWLGIAAPALAVPPLVPAGETRPIADRVYVIPDAETALVPNVGIVIGDERVLVVDTGMGPRNAETVLAEVRKVSDLPIGYLVSTHFHPEHNFGAQSFPRDTILIYSEAQHRDVREKGARYRDWFVEMFGDDVRELLAPVELIPPDVTFESRASFDLGGLPVELHHFGTAAHTRGDTIVFLPEQKIAFVGGLVPNGFFPIMPDADSSVDGWLETLDRLRALGAETLVPGHGPVADAALIEVVAKYLQSVRGRARDLHARAIALESAKETLTAEFSAEYPDWGERHWIGSAVELVYAAAARTE